MRKYIDKIIEGVATARESEIILGDMQEEYETILKSSGKFRADLNYFFGFISLLTNKALKKKGQSRSNFFTMFSNYIKIAFRQLGRQKLHNTINIVGLAIGLAVTLVISLYVVQEFSYDKFHVKKDRIHLLPMTWKFGSTQISIAGSTSGAGPLMKELFNKEIETYVRICGYSMIFNHNNVPVEEPELVGADSTFFDVFTFPLISGNPKTALKEPGSIVLTERAALKYFGEDWQKKDLMSQTMTAQSGRVFKITGIAKNPPETSHITFDVLVSLTSLPKKYWEPDWNSSNVATYVVLDEHASAPEIVSQITERVAKKYGPEQSETIELDLLPLKDVYLYNRKYIGFDNTSDIRYVYIFSAIAALVLIIAIINYMNLSTARSMERAKEVGVRKVVGAVRLELFWQFISESILVSFVAMTIAVLIAWVLLPVFSAVSGKSVGIDFVHQPAWIGVLTIVWMIISFLGGAYPAIVLSSFKPVSVLKGKIGNIGAGAILRKSLVVFQFGVSIFLIVCTLTIGDQLTYMVNTKLGVDKEKLITIQLDSVARANVPLIKNEIATISGVEYSESVSAEPISIGGKTTVRGGDVGEKQIMLFNIGVGPDFVKTSGLEIVSGTDLNTEIPKDGKWEYLLNESAVKFFGWSNEDAIGKKMILWQVEGVVKGVVRDFHFSPLHKPIEPLIVHAGNANTGYNDNLLVRIQGDNVEGVTLALEEKWKKVVPASPFSFTFLDQTYQSLYTSETRLSRIMNVFSLLAIFIAGLGLFGLASYTIMRRTKELGIRKVLGASLSNLLIAVSGGFVRLVIVAFLIATPVSWYVMNSWLSNFAYPVGFNWLIAIGAGIAAVVVAAATVFYHSFEAARVNPATTLRSE
jgi:putative ABC transport system permease protein